MCGIILFVAFPVCIGVSPGEPPTGQKLGASFFIRAAFRDIRGDDDFDKFLVRLVRMILQMIIGFLTIGAILFLLYLWMVTYVI